MTPTTESKSESRDEQLPFVTKVAAGVGESAINLGINLPKQFAFPIYNLALGVSPTLLGVALMIPRIWDAFIDPMLGAWSDRTRTRWGRRRPFMFVGGVFSALMILVLCITPDRVFGSVSTTMLGHYTHRDWVFAGYLCGVSILFYTALATFSIPYGALALELTSNYEERTRLMTFRTFFNYLSGLLIGWLYAIAQSDRFIDPATGKHDVMRGAYAVGVILLVVVLVTTLLPTLLIRERSPVVRQKQSHPPVLRSIGETFRVPAFLMIVSAYTIGFLGIIMVIGVGQYLNFFYVFGGDLQTGSFVQSWAHTTAVLMGLATTVLINRVGHHFEKKTILITCLMVACTGGLLSWFFYRPDAYQFKLEFVLLGKTIKYHFHMLAVSYAMIWPGLAGLLIITPSIIADLCDLDEVKSGSRREGVYWSVFNWIQKTAMSFSLILSGAILDFVGFDAKLPTQSISTVFSMRVCYLLAVSGSLLVAIVVVARIPLTRRDVVEARRTIAARAGIGQVA